MTDRRTDAKGKNNMSPNPKGGNIITKALTGLNKDARLSVSLLFA